MQELHGNERIPVVRNAEVEDLNDAQMADRSRRARFLKQALRELRAAPGEFGLDEFERDQNVECEIARDPHRTHPTFTEQPHELILVCDDGIGRVALTISPRRYNT